jgi:glycosyltransferase involved in cell wall biosynthesis
MATLSTTKKSACLLNLENGDIMKESIERLLKEGVEVIAVDNNSKDSSKEVLKSFEGRITYKIRKKIAGQSENRNWMIKQAHGDYILLLDSDILYHPGSFDYLIKRFNDAPEEVKCIGFDPWRYTNIREMEQRDLPSLKEPFSTHGQPIAYTQYGVFKRELFKDNMWFDEGFGTGYGCEDNDYAIQMLEKGYKCVCIPFLYFHNKHTEHWFNLHQEGTMRVKERQDYFRQKWGQDVYDKYYGSKVPKIDPDKFKRFYDGSPQNVSQQESPQEPTRVYPKIMIGVGICPRTEYARDLFMDWVKNQTYKDYELFIDENSEEENARASRQRIRDQFMKSPCKYLLFCDVDTISPVDAIQKLMDADKDIITGLTTSRLDESVLAFWKNGYPEQNQKREFLKNSPEIVEIDGAGLYLTLIKRPVLEKILFNWNSIVDDAEFFMRARVLGYKIFMHQGILCKHFRDKENYYLPKI